MALLTLSACGDDDAGTSSTTTTMPAATTTTTSAAATTTTTASVPAPAPAPAPAPGQQGADGSTGNNLTPQYCANNQDPGCPAGSYNPDPNGIPNPNGDGSIVPCEGTICTNPNSGAGTDPQENGGTDMQNPNGDGTDVPCEGTICTNPNNGGG
nr:hypothetical protein [Rhodococcus sp. (in: high G+C Gram-positive bacteria)]